MTRPLTRRTSRYPMRLVTLCLFSAGMIVAPAPLSFEDPLPVHMPGIQTADASPLPIAEPDRLLIPAIGVDAHVEDVGIQDDGKLGVPVAVDAAGWWTGGKKPGENGTAVIDGHLDIGKDKGVFWDLHKLREGHRITVVGDDGVRRHFRVASTKLYDVRTADLREIFGQKDGKHLHLITCAGTWDKAMDHYDQRFVVFAEAIEAPKAAVRRAARVAAR